ncbi:MAG: hypothetical protein Q9195_001146 [Heterodermia aff. obscurata]
MAPPIATAKIALTYPIYASDFDPNSNGLLLVGGGGGESRSGVGNKITLIDTTRKQTISEVIDIDLSRDEDSVMSLAVTQSTDSSAIAFAGINSSTADQKAGKNEHLRSFKLQYPPRRKAGSDSVENTGAETGSSNSTTALGRVSLFTPSTAATKEAYQRILRLSPANTDSHYRLGAVATSLEPDGEIVLFDAGQKEPTSQDVRRRIRLEKGQEAGDVDIIAIEREEYLVAYCTDYEVYITRVASSKETAQAEPILVCGTPHPDAFASSKARPKFRSLRFLQPNLLLLLRNKVNRGGAELIVLELPSSRSLGTVVLCKSLHKAIKAATALSVCRLPASVLSENVQNVIGVAGQDNSITILTQDHPQQKPIPSLKFRTHTVLRDVHTNLITSLTFASFRSPAEPAAASPQYIKLASTSIEHTVVVHTLPLTPYPPPSRNRNSTRYVLTPPGRSEATQITFSVLISALMIALGAFFLQAFTEIRGGTPEYLGAKGWLNERVHGWIARPYMFDEAAQSVQVPRFVTQASEAARSEATDTVESIEKGVDSIKIPGVDDLRVPGVEPDPAEGFKSAAAEVVGNVGDKVTQVKDAVQDAGEAAKNTFEQATENVSDKAEKAQRRLGLRNLLAQRSASRAEGSVSSEDFPSDIIVQHDENSKSISADVRDASIVIGDAHKRWEDLEAHERETWKRRLIDAGEWAVEEGEAVLKGVFFQNIALAVGAAVGHGLG